MIERFLILVFQVGVGTFALFVLIFGCIIGYGLFCSWKERRKP